MTAAISQLHSELFRGGGLYRKAVLESLVQTFGSGRFTYNEANTRIREFNRSICRIFLDAGVIRRETQTYPCVYSVHLPTPTHKLTRREIIERWMKRTDAIVPVQSEFHEHTHVKETGEKTHEE